jgi:hypothetical protein
MTVRRLGIYNSQANASHSIAQVNDPFLVSVVATNTTNEPSQVRVWVVPVGATLESQYSYITYDIEIDPGNSLETHRFALNSLDTVRVRSTKTGVSFVCSGIPQTGPIPADEIQTLTNKTISGLNNTLEDIGNSSLVNDSITLMGEEMELGGTVANLDYFQFDTSSSPTPAYGKLWWNSTESTVSLGISSTKSISLGEDQIYRVRNSTGSTLNKGVAVYASGIEPSGRIDVSPYVANGSVREVRFMGLVAENINNGVNGFVQNFGYVTGLDTRGTAFTAISVGDENWAAGDILYVHPTAPGKLTNVKPQHEIIVAIIIKRHQSEGVIFVRPSTGGHLEDIHDISITSPLEGQGLVYEASTGLWKNKNVDAFPSQTGNSGKYLTTNGTATSWATIDLSSYKKEISVEVDETYASELISGYRYFVDTSTSSISLTLPESPSLGNEIQVFDAANNASSNNITLNRNGVKINGGTENLLIDLDGGAAALIYTGSTYGWKVA